MIPLPILDEELLHRLPLPLAQLYGRAGNAKTPLDRHLAAYYLWEASLKLLASVAVVEYARLGSHDPKLVECLTSLARPSLGHWWEYARRLLPALADADPGARWRWRSATQMGARPPSSCRRRTWQRERRPTPSPGGPRPPRITGGWPRARPLPATSPGNGGRHSPPRRRPWRGRRPPGGVFVVEDTLERPRVAHRAFSFTSAEAGPQSDPCGQSPFPR
jgi:hypothetical protein